MYRALKALPYVKTLKMGMKTKGNRNKGSREKNTLVSSFISSFCYLCVCVSRETRETTKWRGGGGGRIITSLYRKPQEKCNAGRPIAKHDLSKKQTLWWIFYSVRVPLRVRIKSGHAETWKLWNRLTESLNAADVATRAVWRSSTAHWDNKHK